MTITKKIGLRLKEIRLSKNISQEDLSFRAELHRTYINSVEPGKRNISLANIEKMAKALDCQIIDFFTTKQK
jgi:transcriptional regulator with XRE-family HTH domain